MGAVHRAGKGTGTSLLRLAAIGWLAAVCLAACSTLPREAVMDSQDPSQEPSAESATARTGPAIAPVRSDPGGSIRLAVASVWLPSTSGFGQVGAVLRRDGLLVLTDQSVSWQFRSSTGLYRTARRIALADIRVVALAESGVDRLIVIQGQDYRYDSFGVTRRDGKAVDPEATVQTYQTLLNLLRLPARTASGPSAF